MALGILFDTPYHTGTGTTNTDVPGRYPVAINGRSFIVDMQLDANGLRGQYFRRQTVALLRDQADQGNIPGEQSINPDDLWRRTAEDWSHGAGQHYFDRKDSDPARFNTSRAVDVWTKWQASLLPQPQQIKAYLGGTTRILTAGPYLYSINNGSNTSVLWTQDGVTWNNVSGGPTTSLLAQASDGNTIYLSYASGLYTTVKGTATATAYGSYAFSPQISLLGYVKGRLMAVTGPTIYNITSAPSAVPSYAFTQANPNFTWTAFAGTGRSIYASGYSGDKGLVYSIGITTDGSMLAQPVVAGELPDGEVPLSAVGYLSFLVLGTSLGVRVCQTAADGSLTLGGLIPTTNPVTCLSPYGRFVWYGNTNLDGVGTGLGRLDLSVFTSPLMPAYANDMQLGTPSTSSAAQGQVTSICQFLGGQGFTLEASTPSALQGVYLGTSAQLANAGTINSGKIGYGLVDPKIAMFVQDKTLPLTGTEAAAISSDSGPFVPIGLNMLPNSTGSSRAYPAGQPVAETFEMQHTLTSAANLTAPVLTRWTMRALPSPDRTTEWILPLVVASRYEPYGDSDVSRDYVNDTDFLFALVEARKLITLQIGNQSYTVFVEDVEQIQTQQGEDRAGFESTVVVSCKQVVN